jgi:hypothetical protein
VIRRLVSAAFVAAAFLAVAPQARAQVSIAVPNIQNPINKANGAVAKTNEQTRAAERVSKSDPGPAAAAQMADQQKQAAGAAQKAAPPAKGAPAKGAPAGKAGQKGAQPPALVAGGDTIAVSRRGTVTLLREAFAYTAGGRRDPFVSLMSSGELRPLLTDLVLTGVIFDETGRRSIAMLVDASTGESYGVRAGETLGRMKVTKIGREDVTFAIDEFGLSRSETLTIDKTRKGPAAGQRRP